MALPPLSDYHVHSLYSMDSGCPMEHSVAAAVRLGLRSLCFTDHTDYFSPASGKHSVIPDYRAAREDFLRLKNKYSGKIELRWGAEFGIQPHTVAEFERDYADYPFDFILLSSHEADDLEYWVGEYQAGRSQLEYNIGYYESIYNTICKYKNYSVLGHLDCMKRYDPAGEFEDKPCEEIIRAILKQAIADGKGLEVNTSCYRYSLKSLTPSVQILKWYRELGGELITFGSDSHTSTTIGDGFEKARATLKGIGFNRYCTFTAMQPEWQEL